MAQRSENMAKVEVRKKSKVRVKFANMTLCCALAIGGITIVETETARMNYAKGQQKVRLEKELEYIKENPIEILDNQEISICTVNVQNKYTSEDNEFQSGSDLVISLVDENIDVIGIQEMKCATADALEKDIKDYQYNLTGEPRWGEGIIGKLFNFANETNSIIGEELYLSETETLPWLPQNIDELFQSIEKGSIMARIVTSSVVAIDGVGYVRCYNTHLDYGVPTIQKRQMDALLEKIDSDYNELALPIILTGDFNAEPESENMKYFMEQLSERGIQVAPINSNTYKGKIKDGEYIEPPKQVDYIFYSNDFTVTDYQVLDNPSSDHNALMLKLSK